MYHKMFDNATSSKKPSCADSSPLTLAQIEGKGFGQAIGIEFIGVEDGRFPGIDDFLLVVAEPGFIHIVQPGIVAQQGLAGFIVWHLSLL